MTLIDLRSDTVTKPTDAMRQAMLKAPVGDDVFEEDPTVKEIEDKSAQLLGKEAGLFVASGTMGNFVAVLTHATRGDEVLVAKGAHIFQYEQGGASTLGGILLHPVGTTKMDPITEADVEENIAPDDVHKAKTRLVCLENTLNGRAIAASQIDSVAIKARANNLSTHMDGARIFNAACALNVSAREIVKNIDTVQFCFSKGLAAPVGSMLLGPRSFIKDARRWRKALGGGMRQAGVIASACIVALDEMIERLKEDHDNAQKLAEGLANLEHIKIDPDLVDTNMVWIETTGSEFDAGQLCEQLKKKNILVLNLSKNLIRAVTHYGITGSDIDTAIAAVKESVSELRSPSRSLS